MTFLVAKFGSFFGNKSPKDPIYTFFYKTSARNRKRVYSSALKKAQIEQKRVMDEVNK